MRRRFRSDNNGKRKNSVNIRIPYRVIKRGADAAAASVLLVLTLPLFAVISVLIKRESSGPVFFVHQRIGLNGERIKVYKFRSMIPGSDDLESALNDEDLESYYREFKLMDDPRVTEVGHALRRMSLDELPQLINVIQGRMSLVGPRPVMEEELSFYTEEECRKFLSVKPGITGYWQVYARNDATYQSHRRQEMELYYADNKSFLLDLKIVLKTPVAVIRKTGVY